MHTDVAVIGAGMGGLAAARYLRSQGFDVLVLEGHDDLGGQWNRHNRNSGVWPEMRTNTARFLTRFSDVRYPDGVAMFPRNGEVLALLDAFADLHGLRSVIRFGAEVTDVCRSAGGGYDVVWTESGEERWLHAQRVVVASGRYNRPEIPPVPGLDTFTGSHGVIHAFRYKEPERYRDKEVVVAGGSISALEIASDLSMMGARRVHLAQRRQRYVMPKMVTGTPIESYVFTRAAAEALATTPVDEQHAATAARVLRLGGDPSRYGAPAPHPDIEKAGVTGSQHYLNLVAEDRISVHPWIAGIDGGCVTFADGSSAEADAVVVATGFDLSLPFLSEDIRRTVNLSRKRIELAEFTFHPDLGGLAFVGLWPQLGPYAVPLELQARWIAYTWGGAVAAPGRAELERGVLDCIAEQHQVGYREQHEMALRFGRLAGVDPAHLADRELQEILPRATLTADSFRLTGPDADPGARAQVVADFWAFAPPEVRAEVEARLGATAG